MTRDRSFLTFALCLLPCALLLAQQPTPTFRAGAVLVTVDTYPQQNGKIVEGLTANDFDVFEDGKPQKVEDFEFIRVEPVLTDDARRDPVSVSDSNRQAADPRSRVFVVYLDQYHVNFDGSRATARPLIDTMRRILTPTDLFGVMTPRMRGRDLTLARVLTGLENQLTNNWPWGQRFSVQRDPEEVMLEDCYSAKSDGRPWMVNDGAVARRLSDVLILRRREDLTLRSLQDLIDHLGTLREGRTVVLLFSDGWTLYQPNASLAMQGDGSTAMPGVYSGPGGMGMSAPAGSRVTPECRSALSHYANIDDNLRFRDIITEANRRNVSFYPINPGGLAVFDEPLSVNSTPTASGLNSGMTPLMQDQSRLTGRIENARTLAENTDGIAVVNTNDLSAGLRRVADDVSAYYLLGYYSTNTKLDGSYHKIQVKMKRPGVNVRARRGYFSPEEQVVAARAAAAAATAAITPALTDALSSISRARPSADLLTYGVSRGAEIKLVVEIPSARVEAGKWAQGGDVEAVVAGASGEALATGKARIEAGAKAAIVSIAAPAGLTGPWRVNVSVSGGGDRLEDRVTVDGAKGATLLGEPLVYRAAPGPRAPIHPAAEFQFRRTERVHVEWPILKPLDNRQARLLGATGQPLAVSVTVAEPQADTLAADLNLAPLGPGDYVIELTAGSGGQTEMKYVGIRVTQ